MQLFTRYGEKLFATEPYHPVNERAFDDEARLPSELLLRVRDQDGEIISPYPAIMAIYGLDDVTGGVHELGIQFDTIISHAALNHAGQHNLSSIAVNVLPGSVENGLLQRLDGDLLSFLQDDGVFCAELHESRRYGCLVPSSLLPESGLEHQIIVAADDICGRDGACGVDVSDLWRMGQPVKIIKTDVNVLGHQGLLQEIIDHVEDLGGDKKTVVVEGVASPRDALVLGRQFRNRDTAVTVQGWRLPSEPGGLNPYLGRKPSGPR